MSDETRGKIEPKNQIGAAIDAAEEFATRWTDWSRGRRPIPARPSRPKCWSGLRR